MFTSVFFKKDGSSSLTMFGFRMSKVSLKILKIVSYLATTKDIQNIYFSNILCLNYYCI